MFETAEELATHTGSSTQVDLAGLVRLQLLARFEVAGGLLLAA